MWGSSSSTSASDTANAVADRRSPVAIHIHPRHTQLPFVFLSNCLNRWSDHYAWPTPLGPKVHQGRLRCLKYLFIKGSIGYLKWFCHTILLKV